MVERKGLREQIIRLENGNGQNFGMVQRKELREQRKSLENGNGQNFEF
jgi:hypothetical protein